MTKGESIVIEQAANGGFIVIPKETLGVPRTNRDMLVFASFDDLSDWMRSNFVGAEELGKRLKVVAK